jgi:hypothetical protein
MELTNRDVAFLIWLAAAAALVLARSRGRKAIAGILGALRGKVALVLVTFATYIAAGLVAVAYLLGFWNTGLLKDTVAWFLIPGMVLLFGFTKAYEGRGYYGRTLIQVIGLTAIVEFYVNLAAFPLWAELALLPMVVFVSALSAVAGLKPETQVTKRFADGLAAVVGFVILVGTAVYVVREWDGLDKAELALSFALPIWLTAATLPFIFGFSLFANYEMASTRIDHFSKNPQDRRRAKLALLVSYRFRNRELHRFAGLGQQELSRSTSWGEARRIIALYRAKARLEEAEKEFKAMRLARFAGVQGTDWEGRPRDQREFEETREALDTLHTFHSAQHKDGRYRQDLMAAVAGLLSKTFPESEIVMTIGPKGRSWFAWRRTISGWVFGIGAAGAPPDKWSWEGPEPPNRPPGPGTAWTHHGFDEDES